MSLANMASVTELAGRDSVELTVSAPMLAVLMLPVMIVDDVSVELVMVAISRVFDPVKVLLPARVAMVFPSDRSAIARPVIVASVTFNVEVTKRLPMFDELASNRPLIVPPDNGK